MISINFGPSGLSMEISLKLKKNSVAINYARCWQQFFIPFYP